jgi:surface protein
LFGIFWNATDFNQDLGNWDVSIVTKIAGMLSGASSFNQDLGRWDVSNATNMGHMFSNASAFNQDLSNWQFNANVLFVDIVNQGFIENSGLDINNYEDLLESFVHQNLINKTLISNGLTYCDTTYREDWIYNKGWTITGVSYSQPNIAAPIDVSIHLRPDIANYWYGITNIEFAGRKIESVRKLKRTPPPIIKIGKLQRAGGLTKIVGAIIVSTK